MKPMKPKNAEALIQEGRNQVLYLMLCIGDENVAHDNWNPAKADVLVEARREILKRLKYTERWPKEWPDFASYTYCPG